MGGLYGARPMAARTEGSERIPREMVSAIMTVVVRLAPGGPHGRGIVLMPAFLWIDGLANSV